MYNLKRKKKTRRYQSEKKKAKEIKIFLLFPGACFPPFCRGPLLSLSTEAATRMYSTPERPRRLADILAWKMLVGSQSPRKSFHWKKSLSLSARRQASWYNYQIRKFSQSPWISNTQSPDFVCCRHHAQLDLFPDQRSKRRNVTIPLVKP